MADKELIEKKLKIEKKRVWQCVLVCESVNSTDEPAGNLIRAYKQVELRLASECIKADGFQAKFVHTKLDPACFRCTDSNVKELALNARVDSNYGGRLQA
jgi:hypothetical protein